MLQKGDLVYLSVYKNKMKKLARGTFIQQDSCYHCGCVGETDVNTYSHLTIFNSSLQFFFSLKGHMTHSAILHSRAVFPKHLNVVTLS